MRGRLRGSRRGLTRTDDYLAVHTGANPLIALTEGFQSAFLAVAILASIGVALALALLGRLRGEAKSRELLEPVPIHAPE